MVNDSFEHISSHAEYCTKYLYRTGKELPCTYHNVRICMRKTITSLIQVPCIAHREQYGEEDGGVLRIARLLNKPSVIYFV